ncbi:hypothetical protein CFK37_18935 [Virgibacillus phasianinus]|uniref:Uncharacterized protein n=1 Tax=Virgibacillus phasianinus TaxID=2017483 RepID=A0A220U887_9BACI|nr:hypothetical protein CFK37_18935 [Virgibacillus phasianinus]
MPAKGGFSRASLTAVLRGLADLSLPAGQGKLPRIGIARRKSVFSFSRSLRIFKMLGKGEKLNL